MNFSMVITSSEQLLLAKTIGVKEVLLPWAPMSRHRGIETVQDLEVLATQATRLGLAPVLVWDALYTQRDLTQLLTQLEQFPWPLFSAVRCQDYGVLEYLLTQTTRSIHWSAQVAHQNIAALEAVEKMVGSRLGRLVLNLELPIEQIASYAKRLNTPLECLGAGPILLFYSPRPLLSRALGQSSIELTCRGESEETPHKDFGLQQNRHGTFMYHTKDFFILDRVEECQQSGVSWLMLDWNSEHLAPAMTDLTTFIEHPSNALGEALKGQYPRPTIRGYFSQNRSDRLFVHLKNQRTRERGQDLLGTIVDVDSQKGRSCMTLFLERQHLRLGQGLSFKTPDGKERSLVVRQMWDVLGNVMSEAKAGQCVVLDRVGGVCVKTQVWNAPATTLH
jgi:putative protease